MKIIVRRGTHQICGCATEISTNSSRILIDAGSELDGIALIDKFNEELRSRYSVYKLMPSIIKIR